MVGEIWFLPSISLALPAAGGSVESERVRTVPPAPGVPLVWHQHLSVSPRAGSSSLYLGKG